MRSFVPTVASLELPRRAGDRFALCVRHQPLAPVGFLQTDGAALTDRICLLIPHGDVNLAALMEFDHEPAFVVEMSSVEIHDRFGVARGGGSRSSGPLLGRRRQKWSAAQSRGARRAPRPVRHEARRDQLAGWPSVRDSDGARCTGGGLRAGAGRGAVYSLRNASLGARRPTRRAGRELASNAAPSRMRVTAERVPGS